MDSPRILQLSVYTMAEKALMATAACSLLVSVLIEVVLFYTISRKTNTKTKWWLRRVLLAVLIANTLLSLGTATYVVSDQLMRYNCQHHHAHAKTQAGPSWTPYTVVATWGSGGAVASNANTQSWLTWAQQSRGIITSQLSCVFVFVFSVILLVSAWLDLKKVDSHVRDEKADGFGEKGEIYI